MDTSGGLLCLTYKLLHCRERSYIVTHYFAEDGHPGINLTIRLFDLLGQILTGLSAYGISALFLPFQAVFGLLKLEQA
jgi:hypothetical protein